MGAAAVINRHFQNGETTCRQLSNRLPDNSTIFAAEATAISLALNYYQHMGPVHHDVVVYSDSMSCLQAIGVKAPRTLYLPYHEPALVIEWQGHTCSFLLGTKPLWHWRKWKSGPTSKRDPRPRYRPTGKCPPDRFETTGQLVHSEVVSNQVGCSCTWQIYIYLVKPTLGPPKKFQHLTRAEAVVITRLRIGHTKATKSHILSRGPPIGCHHCGQTLTTICCWSVHCYRNVVMNTTQSTRWMLSSRQFLAWWNSCEKWDSSLSDMM